MKVRSKVFMLGLLLLSVSLFQTAQAGVDIGIGINLPLPVIRLPAPPELVIIPGTYSYYVPDGDVDIFFNQGRWYRSWGGRWYSGNSYNGPWGIITNDRVPGHFLQLQPGWRKRIVIHERIKYDNFNKNWQNWERDRYWEHKHDWWNKERDEWRDRRDDKRDKNDDRRDRQDAKREKNDARRDRIDNRLDRKDDRLDRKDDRLDRKDDRKDERSGR